MKMKYNLLFIVLIFASSCKGQESNQTNFTYENFEKQIVNYEPKQNETVTKKDFDSGLMIINETKNAIKGNTNFFNVVDYLNIFSAFLYLGESEQNIKLAFEKFKNSEGSCTYLIHLENRVAKDSKYDIIRTEYNNSLKKCKANQVVKTEFNIEKYISENQLNSKLVRLIQKIDIDDQKYRSADEKTFNLKQPKLDRKNAKLIDSLFNKYDTYIGKSLVGEKFEFVMWEVIQHSNLEMMERYLLFIHKAVENNELGIMPFKMLIDRFYGLKYGYQIFGSQNGFGFEMADEKTRKEIELKYGIE
jgi:hypothetical protein